MTQADIHIVNYGVGNLGSLMNMFRRIGIDSALANTPEDVAKARRILLPGVGAFDTGMKALHKNGFVDILNRKILQEKTPILGICLGMQLLSLSSEEGEQSGLGWIKAKTIDMKKLSDPTLGQKFPHIGWNYLKPLQNHDLFLNFPDNPRFYFVHRYMLKCKNSDDILGVTQYGDINVTSMIVSGNISGAQFHPEKSHRFGMQLLYNFSRWNPKNGR